MSARHLASQMYYRALGIHQRILVVLAFVLVAALLTGGMAFASVTASISGTVTDATGATVVGATVRATNDDTGVVSTQLTNAQGYYSFQSLPVGKYTIEVEQKGFKTYHKTGVVLDVDKAAVEDVTLQVGQATEKVEVSSEALHVETSSTQMGEVITGKEMTEVPLVTRSYTDLLALQPGVVSQASEMTGAYAGPFISAGFALPQISGDLNSGALSVNGMREAANGFILNGVTVQETGYSGAGAIPNLDSIAEFRILTNNFDAEYGNYSGGQINVVTKSGTNNWHGNLFEFFRNTDLDAANFFESGHRGAYHQNQFGGTFGGPIKKDKIFFFVDYQGNRVVQAIPQTVSGAPSASTIQGDLSGIASSLTGKVVSDPLSNPNSWANQLSAQLNHQPIQPGEPYYFTGCTTTAQCVFPNAQLNPANFSSIAKNLLPYIQPAASGTINPVTGLGTFSTSTGKLDLNDNKFSGRLDANTRWGLMTAYYYYDNYTRIDPYWASNAPLYPGFSVNGTGITDNVNLGDTKTFSAAMVNEFRLGYFRLDAKFNQPLGGKGVTLSSLGFASGANGAPGIYVGTPSVQGVPEIDFANFVIGVPSRPNRITENIYQVLDNFTKVFGTHTVKVGGQYHYNQLEENLSNVANGNFFFGNINGGVSETGSDFADFLLGAPSSFVQGQSYPSYGRNFYFGLYGQDSWRIKSNLTFNYGLRYDVSAPWHEKYNEIQTLVPGLQSVVFPGSPTGWVFPGDPGIPPSLAPTRWNNFAPRLGLAYSFGDHEGMLGKILGKPGTTSIRVGWGMFFTAFEGATDFNEIGDAPFGNYTGQFASTFPAPFTNRGAGTSIQNLFPVAAPPKNFSASNPATGSPYETLPQFFTAFGTISSSPAFYNHNRLPYAENYELSIQRQITSSDLLTVSYVGTQGHRLLSSLSANPGDPALCLSVNQSSQVLPGTATCGPGGENNIYFPVGGGGSVLGTRAPFSGVQLPPGTVVSGGTTLPNGAIGIIPFGNDSYFITIGNSAYNSAQINWRHTSGRLQWLVAYTFSKALDDSSGYGEQINPVNARLSRGLSAFDTTNNFVISYIYSLPVDKLGGPKRLTNGWQISGITRFATGLPVTLVESDDQSLLGTGFGGPITLPVDTMNFNGGSVGIMNPRKTTGHYYFNPAAFSQAALGTEGTANRRFFHGPGINNWDFAVLKNTQLTERFNLQFRAELFNIFNHAQFGGPNGIASSFAPVVANGPNIPQGSFGQVSTAAPPRIGQLSLKLNF
jgi:hypothetical protein